MRCSAPIQIKNPAFVEQKSSNKNAGVQDRTITVRCGKCEGCLKSNINNWAFRLEQEAKRSLYVHFVTLTYDPKYVPLTDTLLPTLSRRDTQLFFKRLRKLAGEGLKYFIVGEYGSKSYRPHYHAIIFNCNLHEYYFKAWSKDNEPIGNVHIGTDIDNGAIPYTLKYMYKKGLIPQFEGDDRLPEFRSMSKKLGDNYLTDQMLTYHLTDFKNRQFVMLKSGHKVGMPKYYRDRIIDNYDLDRDSLKPELQTFLIDDNPHISLKGRVNALKMRHKNFEEKRNQEQRSKI